jgi:malonyl-ACP decarboxylase
MHAAVTGLGVITATARNLEQFAVALRSGATHFDVLKRPGRAGPQSFPGAEITDSEWISSKPGLLRTASFSSQIAVETVSQAWMDARLQERDIPGDRIGIVIGGTNFQSRHQQQTIERYRASPRLIRPTYGLSFWDSDIIGVLSEYFSIEGESFCVSGASAGGAMAIIHVRHG